MRSKIQKKRMYWHPCTNDKTKSLVTFEFIKIFFYISILDGIPTPLYTLVQGRIIENGTKYDDDTAITFTAWNAYQPTGLKYGVKEKYIAMKAPSYKWHDITNIPHPSGYLCQITKRSWHKSLTFGQIKHIL